MLCWFLLEAVLVFARSSADGSAGYLLASRAVFELQKPGDVLASKARYAC